MVKEIQLDRIDLNLFPVFEAVLAERNVARAAARLHVTPSAVSHGLNRLRQQLNDPLFLKTSKGVVPTARALEIADAVADVLARARRVIGMAEPFDPAHSQRRFTIGASMVLMPELLKIIQSNAPHIDVASRYVLRDAALTELDARTIDLAVVPIDEIPARFVSKVVFEDTFQIAARKGHPFADEATLERYCEMQHVIVAPAGDTETDVDELLASKGMSRHVATIVPSSMLMLAVLAESDMIAALPKRFLEMYGPRYDLVGIDSPLPMRKFQLRAIVPQVAMNDPGLAWLYGLLPTIA